MIQAWEGAFVSLLCRLQVGAARHKIVRSVLGTRLEAQHLMAKPPSAHGADDHSQDYPARADDLRGETQVEPEEKTGQESSGGRPEVAPSFGGTARVVARQSGGIDTHVCQQRPEIQDLGSKPVGDQKGSAERDQA